MPSAPRRRRAGGGALLPAPAAAAGDLWARYTDAWHAVGAGGTGTAPPYLAVVAALATLLLGSTGLAVTVMLVCSVPLAGVTAYFASRPLVESRLLRAWAAVAYAFLPAATGALASGHIGTAVLAVLLPLLARAGIAASGLTAPDGRGSWRATWAYALLLTLTTAFTPIVWPMALVLGLGVLAVRRADLKTYGPRFLAQFGSPLLVLAPWSLSLLPFGFFQEAGLPYGPSAASALDLLGASPGGPGTSGGLLLIGLVLAALAALLRAERRTAILTAWTAALVGLVFAALSNGSAWAGPATLVYGIALLAAGTLGADGARARVAEQSFGWRQPVAALIALACAVGPLVLAVGWMVRGADGPVERRDPVQVPAFVAEESATRDQARTLVLDTDSADRVDYVLVRGSGARMGDAEIAAQDGENELLDKVVANLVAGSGADQADQLGGFAVRYVLVHQGAPREVTRVLDATPGLSRLSQQAGGALWRVDRRSPARPSCPPRAGATRSPWPRDRSRSTPRSRTARRAASCAWPTPPRRAGPPPSTASRSPPPRSTAGPRASNCPPPAAPWTSPTTSRSPTPCGCGRRACSPSSSSSWRCPAAAVTSTTTCPRRSPSRPRPWPVRAAAPAGCAPRPRRRPPRRLRPTGRTATRTTRTRAARTRTARTPTPGTPAPPEHPRHRSRTRPGYGDWDQGQYQNAGYDENAYAAAPYQQYPGRRLRRTAVPGGGLPAAGRRVRPVRLRRPAAGLRPDVPAGIRRDDVPAGLRHPVRPPRHGQRAS